MKKVKFIYFDVGNVLNEFEHSFDETTRKFNILPTKFMDFWMENEDNMTRGKLTPEKFWEKAVGRFKLKNYESYDFPNRWVNGYTKQTKTHELIIKLNGKHKIGLLTNHYIGMVERSIKNGMIPNIDYQVIISSCTVGFRKPEREIYKIATEKAGVLPGEILFTDDVTEYVEGARLFGWQTVWFDQNNIDKTINKIEKLLNVEDY